MGVYADEGVKFSSYLMEGDSKILLISDAGNKILVTFNPYVYPNLLKCPFRH